MASLIIIVAMFALLWLLLIRPQRAKQQQQQQLLSSVEPGDEILTVGGLYGIVQEIDEDDDLVVEIAEGIHVRVARRAVATVVKPEDEEEGEEEDAAAEIDGEGLDGEADLDNGEEAVDEGEAEVKGEVESVNSQAAAPTQGDERS